MSKHIVETTEKADLISQEEKMVVVKKECNALIIDDEITKHLTGQIKLTSSKDDLIKYLENKAWELKKENQQLKEFLKECRRFFIEGTKCSLVSYHKNDLFMMLEKINNAIGEKK